MDDYDLKSSRSIQGYTVFLNLEMLDTKIASALKKVIRNAGGQSSGGGSFFRGRQAAHMIYHCVLVIGAHGRVLDYADLFTITLRDDDVQEFDTRWDEILLSMTKIPPDDVLESFYNLRIRESDQFKNRIGIVYDTENH